MLSANMLATEPATRCPQSETCPSEDGKPGLSPTHSPKDERTKGGNEGAATIPELTRMKLHERSIQVKALPPSCSQPRAMMASVCLALSFPLTSAGSVSELLGGRSLGQR